MAQNSFYVQKIRPGIKAVLHFFTGETEIERVSKDSNMGALEQSINYSKTLTNYKQRHPPKLPYDAELATELMAIKNITNTENQSCVRKMVEQLHSWKHAKSILEARRAQAYDRKSQQNQFKIYEIWENLMPDEKLSNRMTEQWIKIGFQGEDPATDFRGSGCLGLDNLHTFSSSPKCKAILSVARHPGTDYFFSSASIFLTMTALELVKLKVIPVEYWVLVQGEDVLQKFQKVFEMVFNEFDAFWMCVKNKSLMQFNVNLLAFARQIKRYSAIQVRSAFLRTRH